MYRSYSTDKKAILCNFFLSWMVQISLSCSILVLIFVRRQFILINKFLKNLRRNANFVNSFDETPNKWWNFLIQMVKIPIDPLESFHRKQTVFLILWVLKYFLHKSSKFYVKKGFICINSDYLIPLKEFYHFFLLNFILQKYFS